MQSTFTFLKCNRISLYTRWVFICFRKAIQQKFWLNDYIKMTHGIAFKCIQGESLFYYFKYNFRDFHPAFYCYSDGNICKWAVFICSLCYLDREIVCHQEEICCNRLTYEKSNVWVVEFEFWFETLIYLHLYMFHAVDRRHHGKNVYQNKASAKFIMLVALLRLLQVL